MKLRHGGELNRASAEFAVPYDQWIDLSTGISPFGYPVPPPPAYVWQRLPEEDDALLSVAADYYGCAREQLIALPGTQAAIEIIPTLFPPATVATPLWGYEEHRHCWQQAGHTALYYRSADELERLVAEHAIQHAVVINPNNPSCEFIERQQCLALAERLSGQLILDEAFIDCSPEQSLAPVAAHHKCFVLRSVGKFFGLAGIRLGFLFGDPAQIQRVSEHIAHWAVSHPARWLGVQALADKAWQTQIQKMLRVEEQQWKTRLSNTFSALSLRSTPLFVTGMGDPEYCHTVYLKLARQGVLIRHFTMREGISALRFSLPADAQKPKLYTLLQRFLTDRELIHEN